MSIRNIYLWRVRIFGMIVLCLIGMGALAQAATISGTVYQSNGTTPLTGVSVNVDVIQGDPCGNWQGVVGATTNSSNGTYTITGVPAGTYYLHINNNGTNYVQEWWASPSSTLDCNGAQTVTVTAGGTTSGKNFQLDLGGTISGTVYQSNGTTPVTGVQVQVHVQQGTPCGSMQLVAGSQTNSTNGTYTITGVPVGTYYLQTWNNGTNYLNEWWASPNSVLDCSGAQTVTVTAGATTSGKNFQLDLGGAISGTVYQSNGITPITGGVIGVRVMQGDPCGNQNQVGYTNTNSDGTYTVTGLPAGTYYLQTQNNGVNYLNEWWASPNSTLDCNNAQQVTVTAGATTPGKDFQLDLGGTITGTVYQSNGTTPVTGVQVHISVGQGDPCGSIQWVGWSDTNPADGTYTITGVPAGTYYLNSYNMGQSNYVNEWWASPNSVLDCSGAQTVTVTAGGTTSGKNFQLDLGGTISGTVYQSNGTTPITGVQIGVNVQQGGPCGPTQGVAWTQTNSTNGTYTITGVPVGTYYLQTNNNGTNYVNEWWASPNSVLDCSSTQTVTVTAGGTVTGKNFQLDLGGTISGTVYQSNGTTPVTGVQVQVNVQQGTPCGSMQGVAGSQTNSTNGTYTITGVPVGTYYLQTWNDGTHNYVNEWWASPNSVLDCNGAQTVTVTAGATTSGKNFQLDLGGKITGHVYESDGTTPIQNLHVHANDYTTNEWIGGFNTDATGAYSIVLPSGTYRVQTCSNCTGLNYVNEYYNNVLNFNEATPVSVTAPNETPNINFVLEVGASISGTVYQSNGTTPITGGVVGVGVIQGTPCGNRNQVGYTNTNADGTYTVTGLPAGTYYLQTQNNGTNYVNEWWASPNSVLDCSGAQTVTVTAGGTASGRNFQLDLGGRIEGTITRSDGITPIGGIYVSAQGFCWQGWYGGDRTVADGTYAITGLPAGTYYIITDTSPQKYINEWWDGVGGNGTSNCEAAVPVTVVSGGTTSGIDLALTDGGSIAGHVYQSDGATPISNVVVFTTDYTTSEWKGGTTTGPDGSYLIALPTGAYRVKTCAACNGLFYVDEYYDNTYEEENATPVSVTVPNDTTGIDFALELGGQISGTVYHSDGITPITGVQVGVDVIQGDPCGQNQGIAHADTNSANGTYTITGVPAGAYYVQTWNNGTHYLNEWWASPSSQRDCHNAQTVTVTAGGAASGKNFQLDSGVLISGSVRTSTGAGITGVGLNGFPDATWTDTSGAYNATVESGWSGTVTPQKAGYVFVPTSRTYTNVTADLVNQNYTGTQYTYLLWTRASDGRTSVWTLNANGGFVSAKGYQASGWIATSYQRNTDGTAQLLWTRASDGRASVWTLNASGGFQSARGYQASGWVATSSYHTSDNSVYLSWTRASDGRASVWKLNASGGFQSAWGYQANGWQATSVHPGGNGSFYLLWTRPSDGKASVWKLNASGGFQSAWGYQASGWQATSLHRNGDGTFYLLWTRASDGRASVWRLNASGGFQSAWGYQANGWTAQSVYGQADSSSYRREDLVIVVRKAGTGNGTILTGQQACDAACPELAIPYIEGSMATLQVVPEADSVFVGWETVSGVHLETIYYAQPGETVIAVFEKK